jgi:AcrR family transcriptional regulator
MDEYTDHQSGYQEEMIVSEVERADAARNRQAILEAADQLFSQSISPGAITMDDVARAAGVGKGTLFRRFGDRSNLIRQVYARKLSSLRWLIESGPTPLGPSTPPSVRVAAIIDEIAQVKMQNACLTSALESADDGGTGGVYSSSTYREVHHLLTDLIMEHSDGATASWTAHTLLTMVRADLLRHLTEGDGMSSEEVRLRLRQLVSHLVGPSEI